MTEDVRLVAAGVLTAVIVVPARGADGDARRSASTPLPGVMDDKGVERPVQCESEASAARRVRRDAGRDARQRRS